MYYLHRILKKHYTVNARSKEIQVDSNLFESGEIILKDKILELCKLGYNIQSTIV